MPKKNKKRGNLNQLSELDNLNNRHSLLRLSRTDSSSNLQLSVDQVLEVRDHLARITRHLVVAVQHHLRSSQERMELHRLEEQYQLQVLQRRRSQKSRVDSASQQNTSSSKKESNTMKAHLAAKSMHIARTRTGDIDPRWKTVSICSSLTLRSCSTLHR